MESLINMRDKKELQEVLDYIEKLEHGSFECWSDDAEKGYRTALISIREKIKSLRKNNS